MIFHSYNERKKLIKSDELIFGPKQSHFFFESKIDSFFKSIFRKIQNHYPDIKPMDFNSPNNALIGNKNYSAIWRSYRMLKSLDDKILLDLESFNSQITNLVQRLIILHLISTESYEVIEKISELLSLNNAVYSRTNENINIYRFNCEQANLEIIKDNYCIESKKLINNLYSLSST